LSTSINTLKNNMITMAKITEKLKQKITGAKDKAKETAD
jgi:hypothetical protein